MSSHCTCCKAQASDFDNSGHTALEAFLVPAVCNRQGSRVVPTASCPGSHLAIYLLVLTIVPHVHAVTAYHIYN